MYRAKIESDAHTSDVTTSGFDWVEEFFRKQGAARELKLRSYGSVYK